MLLPPALAIRPTTHLKSAITRTAAPSGGQVPMTRSVAATSSRAAAGPSDAAMAEGCVSPSRRKRRTPIQAMQLCDRGSAEPLEFAGEFLHEFRRRLLP